MSIYIYAPHTTQGLPELVEQLQAKRLRKHDGMHFLSKGTPLEFSSNDVIVNWGCMTPPIPNIRSLNTSYKYTDLRSVNVKGLTNLRKLGMPTFAMQEAPYGTWKQGLQPADQHWYPKKQTRNGYVSVPEVEGYLTSWYNFSGHEKLFIFRGKTIIGNPLSQFDASWQHLDLDFAELHIGKTRSESYLLKVIPAPNLAPADVKIVAEYISLWANEDRKE